MIDEDVLRRTLHAALRTGGDFAEVFAEDRRGSTVRLDDGRLQSFNSGRERGAGIRVVAGHTTGYAHTADLTVAGLRAAAEAAAAVARHTTADGDIGDPKTRTIAFERTSPSPPLLADTPESVEKDRKAALLLRADEAARSEGGAIKQLIAVYADSRRRILVANSDGVLAEDDQVRTRFTVQAVAAGDTGMQTGYESTGFTMGFELFDTLDVEEFARTAARRALKKLNACPAPSGAMPVVINRGGGGVMFHEACGHGLEADLVGKDASVYAGRRGELVASPLVTLVDDGTMGPEWGAYAVDDEGRPAARNVLIENGVLTDYLWDHLRARKAGRPTSSGNGRRESYRHTPMVRMTNTFVLNGTEDPDEIVRQTPRGVYIANLGGGQVDTATGDFVFGMTEAYLIEDGRITDILRDANLIGNGPEVLRNIDAIADDFAMGPPGMCGKDGQSVPVGDGNPTLRVTSLTIGGTAA